MNRALALARSYGVGVRVTDLGAWESGELRAEYDPAVPEIRINARAVEERPLSELGAFVTLAIGHELYHHREHLGEVPRLPSRAQREAAADAYARELLETA